MKNRTYLPNLLHRVIALLMLVIIPIYAIGSDVMGDYRFCSFHFDLVEQTIPEIVVFDDSASFIKQRSLRDGEKEVQPLPIFSFDKQFSSLKVSITRGISFIPFNSSDYFHQRNDSVHVFHCCFLI